VPEPPRSQAGPRLLGGSKLQAALAALLVVCTLAVYFPVTSYPFVNFDDGNYVAQNPHIQQGLTLSTVLWAVSSMAYDNWHPVTWLSHALDWQLYGAHAGGHHTTNLVLHLLNVVLLLFVLMWMTGQAGKSFFVAALFAVHPINVESVAWVAERKNLLSMFFFLLTLAAYVWYVRQPKWWRYGCGVALFAIGLAAKPMIVTLPFVLMLLDYWPLRRVKGSTRQSKQPPLRQKSWRWLALEKVPLLILSVASCVVTLIAQRGAIASSRVLPFQLRLWNAICAYGLYLAKAVRPASLAVYYPRAGLNPWTIAFVSLVLIGLSAVAWRERSSGYATTGWLWFLGTPVPMIGLVQVGDQAMADRYAYLPLIGIFIVVAWGSSDFARSRKIDRRYCIVAGGVVIFALAWLTSLQVGVWRSSVDLWKQAIAVTKDNYVADDNLAYELLAQGHPQEALHYFQEAARLAPQDPLSHWALAANLEDQGRLTEAAQQYEVVVRNPENRRQLTAACLNAAVIASELGDYSKASEYSQQALQTDAAIVRTIILNAERDVAQSPSPGGYLRLGLLLEQAGETEKAQHAYEQVVRLDPNSLIARQLLSHVQGNHVHVNHVQINHAQTNHAQNARSGSWERFESAPRAKHGA